MTSNCIVCKKPLTRQKKTCSKECQYKSFRGSGNPMFKDAKLTANCKNCGATYRYHAGTSGGKYCSAKCHHLDPVVRLDRSQRAKGRPMSLENRLNMSARHKGKKRSPESIAKMKATSKARWDRIGRKSDKIALIRTSKANNNWRKAVYERDNFTCQHCGDSVGGNLEADHIISLAFLHKEYELTGVESFYEADNGRTLCKECHKKTLTYSRHWSKTLEGKLMLAIGEGEYRQKMERLIDQFKERLHD